jgi:serine/threonine protein kinase/tetratricopeptide (TPR) repeat protein
MSTLSELQREQRLDEVLASYLQPLKEGRAPGRQELIDSHPELAGELAAFFADQDHFDRLAAPLRGLAPAKERLSNVRNFGDYEVLEEIARGGMGVVFKAWQKSLGRVVALKMLLAGPWASSADLQRFRTEAESAAQLDHPNIMPIYEVGAHDGHAYLSMKLIEGGSLAHRLSALGPRPSAHEAAWLLATLADAVHYAHQRGILHRDLKPANVLLQQREAAHHEPDAEPKADGESPSGDEAPATPEGWSNLAPVITDFGLAKRAARPGQGEEGVPGDQLSQVPTLPLPQARTHTGAIVGTPGYMAPEQASGSPAAVTTAADVYGLGAILYEMLTGRPPFKGPTPLDTMRQMLEQEPARPSALNPASNRDLETICLKCLQKEPARRYASARELSEDLHRFLRDEPILARPVGPLRRAWRLARRQPLVASLTLALAAVFLGGTSGVVALWRHAEEHARTATEQRQRAEEHFRAAEQERDKARIAQEQAEHHLEDSERSFRMAHQAVHAYCRRVSDELRDAPHLQPLRKALLQDALAYYQHFLDRPGHDPALRRELADTYQSMAAVTSTIGARADARKAYEQALAIYDELERAEPGNVELQRKRGSILNSIAILFDASETCLDRLKQAHDTYNRYLQARPVDRGLRSGLGVTLNNLGTLCQRTGRPEARDWFEKARILQERLLAEHPSDLAAKAHLANTLSNYAVLRGREADGRDDALHALRRARDLRSELVRARPRSALAQADLAASHFALGLALRDSGKNEEALRTLQQSHKMRLQIARENPFVTRYQIDLAASYITLGLFHSRQNRKDRALECYERARDIQDRVVRIDPGSTSFRRELGLSYYNIGALHGRLKRRAEEHQALLKARELQDALVKADPDNLDFRFDLGRTLNRLAWNRLAQSHPEEVPPLMREAIEHARRGLERAPTVPVYRQHLNSNYGTLMEAEVRLGHTRAAADALRERQKLWPDNPTELVRIARALTIVADRVGGGKPDLTEAEKDERQQDLECALTILRRAVALGFRDVAPLRTDKAYDPLRSQPEFQELIREMERKTPP